MQRKSLIVIGTVFSVLLLTGGGLAYLKYRQNHPGGPAGPAFEPSETVETATAATTPFRPTAKLVGTAIATQWITVSNEVAGNIRDVAFESGSVVEKGAVLLTLDASTEEADLAAAEASVRVAEANVVVAETRVKLAETNVRRVTQAVQAKATSEADLDRAGAEVDSARADIERVRAEVDQAKSRAAQARVALEKKTIRAPFRGRTGLRNVHPGQYLAEGSSVVTLQGIDENVYLDFAVPQEQLFRVRVGDTVTATSGVFGAEPIDIRVVSIDATVNPSTRNVRVRGMVKNPDELIRPGMFIDVEVPIGDMQQFTTVPISALRRASYGDHVFVLAKNDKGELRAQQRFVKIGPTMGDRVVISEGLALGEEVATSGSFKLREGLLVNRSPQEAAPAVGQAGGESPVVTAK